MASNVTEAVLKYPLTNDRVVTITVRDKIAPEHVLVNRATAKLLALRSGEALDIVPLSRKVKDLMIKTNIVS